MGPIKRNKPKPRPKPTIDYPPVPTKKWIPPDKRPKPPKPPPAYTKPEGMSQRLAISSLKKVWNQFEILGDTGLIIGHYSQTHKKYTFKTNGYQGACNCAVACIFAHLYKMATYDRFTLDKILDIGDELYQKSVQPMGDTCYLEIDPKLVFNSIFIGSDKITFVVDDKRKIADKLNAIADNKVKDLFQDALEKLFQMYPSGIFSMKGKYLAVWIQDKAYYLFDPTEHEDNGELWTGIPGWGVSVLYRCKQLSTLIDNLYKNVDATVQNTKFEVIGCCVERIIKINIVPPETFEEVITVESQPPTEDIEQLRAQQPIDLDEIKANEYLAEELTSVDMKTEEISPDIVEPLDEDKRESWMGDEIKRVVKTSPFPLAEGKVIETISYYTELTPGKVGILRGTTCQTDVKLSKYQGRQSMGNAISALTMLRFYKSSEWTAKIVNTILKNGDLLYREAMITIPRTQSLKLSNFQKKSEYEGKLFLPVIDDYVVIGKLQSQDFDVLDLYPALENFLTDYDSCIILGPLVLAVWVENDQFYMFDPNERDKNGKAIAKSLIFGTDLVQLEFAPGVACVTWFQELQDLVDLYMSNVDRNKKMDTFYLSRVEIKDFVDIPEPWYQFKGFEPGKWILRGTMSQASKIFGKNSRNLQSPAICLIAIAIQALKPVKDWSEEVVDEVLKEGDTLYNNTLSFLTENDKFENRMLTLNEVIKKYNLYDKMVNFAVDECLVTGILNASNTDDESDLGKGLETFFIENDFAIVTSRNISVAVWKRDNFYYVLDSHDRDEKGLATGFGTACILRIQVLEDVTNLLETNFGPGTDNLFNIHRINFTFFELGDGDTFQPPINNYTLIKPGQAILRSIYSEISNKYGVNIRKQTIPMCLVALAYNKLKPSLDWTKADLDEVLNKGDNLYVQTMTDIQDQEEKELIDTVTDPPEPPQDEAEDGEDEQNAAFKIDIDNVKNEFYIGPNKFVMEFEDLNEGNIKQDLRINLKEYFEQPSEVETEYKEVVLQSNPLNIAIWRDENLFYLFDSKPRDKKGLAVNIIQWIRSDSDLPKLAKIEEKDKLDEEEEEVEETPPQSGPAPVEDADTESIPLLDPSANERETAVVDFDAVPIGGFVEGQPATKQYFGREYEYEAEAEGEEEGSEDELEKYYPLVVKSSSFWREKEKAGKACVMWFTTLQDLIDHIYNNIPAWETKKEDFLLKSVKFTNNLNLKNKFKAGQDRNNVFEGNWFNFKELDFGKWILRGTMTIFGELFPQTNRGKQQLTTALLALAIQFVFSITGFSTSTVDTILRYGDKLYTYIKRLRKKEILANKNANISGGEVDWLLQNEEVVISDIPKKLCVSKYSIEVEIQPNVITGDIKAQNFEDVLDVERGLQTFFEENRFGILQAKGLTVAIWKMVKTFFMFDGLNRGPNGIVSPYGTACVTRYLEVQKLANDFLKNLPEYGKNNFTIHGVVMAKGICPRENEPKEMSEPVVTVKGGGFKEVMAGKQVITASINQEDPKFGKEPNTLSAPIAIIALTMTLLHRTTTWSKPLLDDIIETGNELYDETVNELGYDFDTWQDKLDLYKLKSDYTVGLIKANCELRLTIQSGIIDSKNPQILNLRQGIEAFFEENTHGVIVTEPLTIAMWEEEQPLSKIDIELNPDIKPTTLIYIFDPNPRSSTGMPLFTGTACLVSFLNHTMAAEHIISCILQPELRHSEFSIIPVEIVVGNLMTRRKLKRKSTKSSVNLPRCSRSALKEERRLLMKIAEDERRKKDAKRIRLLGRKCYYVMRNGQAIIRGFLSQNSVKFSEPSRNNQDIPNCIIAIVMHHICTVDNWNGKHIDMILTVGDQLYIDSYISYTPTNKKLGLENVMRKFFMSLLSIHVTVYKPIFSDLFSVREIQRALEVYFTQETFCMLSYMDQWVSIFFKTGLYYIFDPHERNIEGNQIKAGETGTAVVHRFNNLENLCEQLIDNLYHAEGTNAEQFTIWLISVGIKY